MSNQILGINTHLLLNHTGESPVSFTGVASGADSITNPKSLDSADVAGGRGITASQPGRFIDQTFAHGCRSNEQLDPVMNRSFGARLECLYAERGGSIGSTTHAFEAVCQPTLTFGFQSNVVSWTNTLTIDGTPVVGTTTSAIPRVTDAVESYKTSECDFYFGNAGLLINFRPELRSDVVLSSTSNIVRDRADITPDIDGMTADCIGVGFSISATFALSENTDKLSVGTRGIFVVRRKDANYGYAIPCWIASEPVTSAAAGVVTKAVSFSQLPAGVPVGSSIAGEGSLSVPVGNEGNIVDVTGSTINRVRAGDHNVPADGFAVQGAPILGEAVK